MTAIVNILLTVVGFAAFLAYIIFAATLTPGMAALLIGAMAAAAGVYAYRRARKPTS